MERILIIDNAKIGDVVCVTPALRAIKEKYPQSQITFLGNPKTFGILRHNPRVAMLVAMPKTFRDLMRTLKEFKGLRFDASVAMVPGTQNYVLPFLLGIPVRSATVAREYGIFYRILATLTANYRQRLLPNVLSIKHYLSLLEPLGIISSDLSKEVFYTEEASAKAEAFLASHGIGGQDLLGISVTAGNKIKEWPAEKFVAFGVTVYEKYGLLPVVFGGHLDAEVVARTLDLFHKQDVPAVGATGFSLEELPAILSKLTYFVSVDTGTLYIANSLGIPVVDIAGPCNINDQMPIYEKCEVVYVAGLTGWPYSSVLKTAVKLNKDEMRAIDDITPTMVLTAFDRLVDKYGKK